MKGVGLLSSCVTISKTRCGSTTGYAYLEFQIEVFRYWLQVLSLAAKNTSVHTKDYLYKPDRIL